jgi:photosystem II stability/assembly factor-like uncharacterized protein
MSFLSPEEGFVTGWTADRSQVLATRDGGQTWQPIYDGDREFFLFAVHFLDRQQGFAAGGVSWYPDVRGGMQIVLATEDCGVNWDVVYRRDHPINGGGLPITRLRFSTPTVGWAATGGCYKMGMNGPCGGLPLFTSDGGHTWTVTGYMTMRFASVGTSAWIAGNPFPGHLGSFSLARTTDAGASWTAYPPDRGRSPAMYGVHFLDERMGWIWTGTPAFQTRDGGEHWAPSRLVSPQTITVAPTGADSAVGYVRSDRGVPRLVRTEDGGRSWQPVLLPPRSGRDDSRASLAFADRQFGWLAMETFCKSAYCPMVLYASADGGRTWEERTASFPRADRSWKGTVLAFGDEQHGAAINRGGHHLLLTADGGRTWRDQSLAGLMKTVSLSYVGASEVWVAGSDEARGVVLHSRDAGQHWEVYRFEAVLPYQTSFTTAKDGLDDRPLRRAARQPPGHPRWRIHLAAGPPLAASSSRGGDRP